MYMGTFQKVTNISSLYNFYYIKIKKLNKIHFWEKMTKMHFFTKNFNFNHFNFSLKIVSTYR